MNGSCVGMSQYGGDSYNLACQCYRGSNVCEGDFAADVQHGI